MMVYRSIIDDTAGGCQFPCRFEDILLILVLSRRDPFVRENNGYVVDQVLECVWICMNLRMLLRSAGGGVC